MKLYKNENFPQERALYAEKDIELQNCTFEGELDGESALKETRNVTVYNCKFDLRYPLWHGDGIIIKSSKMTDKCRAALWYSKYILVADSELLGIKALRECKNTEIKNRF